MEYHAVSWTGFPFICGNGIPSSPSLSYFIRDSSYFDRSQLPLLIYVYCLPKCYKGDEGFDCLLVLFISVFYYKHLLICSVVFYSQVSFAGVRPPLSIFFMKFALVCFILTNFAVTH